MKNKTICFFNSAKVWGGGEKWHFDMARLMHKNKINVVFFVNKNSSLHHKLKDVGIKTIHLSIGNLSFLNPIKINFIKEKLLENNVDAIIINLSADLKIAGLAAKKAKIKRIIYRRGSAIPIKDKIINRYIFKNIVTDIIANTYATKKSILQNNNKLFNPKKIQVIYNGIDIKKLHSQEQLSYYKKTDNEFIIGNLGRLEYQKAQHLLLDLAVELKKKNFNNFKIIIAGTGRLENDLKQKCKELELCNEIIFSGFAEKVKGFYLDIDIFILTSLWEGFGYVIAEAMAFKKPVIAFDISSNPELIENEKTGYLTKFDNIEAMAEKVIKLSKDKKLMKEMGENAFKKVNSEFTLERAYENLIVNLSN